MSPLASICMHPTPNTHIHTHTNGEWCLKKNSGVKEDYLTAISHLGIYSKQLQARAKAVLQSVEGLPTIRPWARSLPDMVIHACNPDRRQREEDGESQGYIVRSRQAWQYHFSHSHIHKSSLLVKPYTLEIVVQVCGMRQGQSTTAIVDVTILSRNADLLSNCG